MKKFSGAELEGFSKLAAGLYLEQKVPLNETIEKIARDNSLNYDQTSRIVEEANTSVYINLFNKTNSKDKYIEFKTASIKEIWPRIKSEDLPKTSHYDVPPDQVFLRASTEQIPEFTKVAEEVETFEGPTSKSHAEIICKIHEKARNEQIKNAQLELELAIDRVVSSITKDARQSILGGDSTTSEISYAVKHAMKGGNCEKIATYIISQLPKVQRSEKVAGTLDTSHEFYQRLIKLGELVDIYIESHKHPEESVEKISAVLKWMFTVPAITGAGVLGLTGAYKAGKTKGQSETSITRDPALYMTPKR
jgi:hypothetical protein